MSAEDPGFLGFSKRTFNSPRKEGSNVMTNTEQTNEGGFRDDAAGPVARRHAVPCE